METKKFDKTTKDGMSEIREDAIEVFHYDKELTPQNRAHKYLEDHKLNRGYNDTALQVCVLDLIDRAYLVGAEKSSEGRLDLDRKAATLTRVSAELLQVAIELRSLTPDGHDDADR